MSPLILIRVSLSPVHVSVLNPLSADIQQKDREVLELLQERVTLFSDLAEVTGACEVPLPINTRNLFRANTAQAPRAEKLLLDAITEGTHCGGRDLTTSGVWSRRSQPFLFQRPPYNIHKKNWRTGSPF